MQRSWVALVACALSACVSSTDINCADGRVCPSGTTCEETHQLCVTPAQRTACANTAPGSQCSFGLEAAGTCIDGLCLPTVCGDGVIEGAEQCEGPNLQGVTGCLDLGYYNDGPVTCSTDCKLDRSQCSGICGDGTVDSGFEACDSPHDVVVAQCDDAAVGFYNPGNVHCNAACQLDTTACTGTCGDGIINGAEVCDGAPPGLGCLGYGFDYGAIACANCGPAFEHCGLLGVHQEGFQTPGQVRYIMGSAPNDYWLAGYQLAVHVVDHVAKEYTLADGGTSLWVQGNEVFVGGGVGTIHHGVTDATGTVTFNDQTVPLNDDIILLAGAGTNDIYGIGQGEIFHYNGAVWSLAFAAPTTDSVLAMWAGSGTDIWLSTNELAPTPGGTLWHYDGSWHAVTLPSGFTTQNQVSAIWGADATHVYIGGSFGYAMWNGASFDPMIATDSGVQDIHGASANDIAVLTGDQIIRWDGVTWNQFASGFGARVWDSGHEVYASGYIGAEFLSPSGWEPMGGTADGLFEMWAGDGTALAIGYDQVSQRDADGNWFDSYDPLDQGVDLWGFAANDIWLATASTVVHYDGTWNDESATLTSLGITGGLHALWGSSSNDLWTCDDTRFFHWTGASWAAAGTTGTNIQKMRGSTAGDIWAADDSPTLLHYNGTSWTPTTVAGASWHSLFVASPTLVYAGGTEGTVATWDGTSWTVVQTPTIGTITAIWAASASDVFVSDALAAIFHYDGVSWTPVRNAGINELESAAMAGDAKHVYFAGGDGIVTLFRGNAW